MRTLAMTAALATALTGTGCFVATSEPTGDLDLAWQFRNSEGVLAGTFTPGNSGCATAAVTDVRLVVRDAFTNRLVLDDFYPCVDGTSYPRAYVRDLPAGSYDYRVEAWRVDAPVFDAIGSVDIFDRQVTPVDTTLDVLPVAPLTVYFLPATCSGTPNIRFDLFFPASSSTLVESTTVPCTTSHGFTVTADQPTGLNYGFDIYALTPGGSSLVEQCLQTVRHTGFPVDVTLVAPAASLCTG